MSYFQYFKNVGHDVTTALKKRQILFINKINTNREQKWVLQINNVEYLCDRGRKLSWADVELNTEIYGSLKLQGFKIKISLICTIILLFFHMCMHERILSIKCL